MSNERRMMVVAAGIVLLMGLEVYASAADRRATAAPWAPFIEKVDESLAAGKIGDAERALHDANSAALGSGTWEGMAVVGDAYRRVGDATGFVAPAKAKARQAYLTSFFRARTQQSLDGVLRATEGFAALGDRQVVAQCLKTAEQMAARSGDQHSRDRMATSAEAVAGRVAGVEPSASY